MSVRHYLWQQVEPNITKSLEFLTALQFIWLNVLVGFVSNKIMHTLYKVYKSVYMFCHVTLILLVDFVNSKSSIHISIPQQNTYFTVCSKLRRFMKLTQRKKGENKSWWSFLYDFDLLLITYKVLNASLRTVVAFRRYCVFARCRTLTVAVHKRLTDDETHSNSEGFISSFCAKF